MPSIVTLLYFVASYVVLGFVFAYGFRYLAKGYLSVTGDASRLARNYRFSGSRVIHAKVVRKRYSNGPASIRREPMLAVVTNDSESIEGIVEPKLYFTISEGDWVDLVVSCDRRPHFMRLASD